MDEIFLPEADGYLHALRDASRSPEERAEAARSLRDAAGLVGAETLQEAASVFEIALRTGDLPGTRRALSRLGAARAALDGPPMSPPAPDEREVVLPIFLEEAREHVETLTASLLSLRSHERPTAGLLEELLRHAHTVKGSAGIVGLHSIGDVAHRLEDHLQDALAALAEGRPLAIEALLAEADSLRAAVNAGDEEAAGAFRAQRRPRVHVEVDRIDRLVESVEELLYAHAGVERRVAAMLSHLHSFGGAGEAAVPLGGGADLALDVASVSAGLGTLRERLEHLRRTPAHALFARLERAVQEAARATGKQAEVRAAGGDTEIDRRIVEGVADAFVQLGRNAVAHGIELPSLRERHGKPVRGVVSVSARAAEDAVVLEVADDGGGVDRAALRATLVASGRLSAEATRQLADEELLGYLFLPGVSTRAGQVDRLAGRGIGLDIVRDAVASLGGSVSVSSAPGTGTRFTLRLPPGVCREAARAR